MKIGISLGNSPTNKYLKLKIKLRNTALEIPRKMVRLWLTTIGIKPILPSIIYPINAIGINEIFTEK